MNNDDPFDSDFFNEHHENVKEQAKEQSFIRRHLGFGLLAGVVIILLNLIIYVGFIAVALWVALTILQHFGVLMLGMGLVL